MRAEFAPKNEILLVKNVEPVKYVKIIPMSDVRWVLDVMLKNGWRGTDDLIDGDAFSFESMKRELTRVAISKSLDVDLNHFFDILSHFLLEFFPNGTVSFEGSGLPINGKQDLTERYTLRWNACTFKTILRRVNWLQYEELARALRSHYGLKEEPGKS